MLAGVVHDLRVEVEIGDDGGWIGREVQHQGDRFWHRVMHRPIEGAHELR